MRLLDRYIANTVTINILLVLTILLSLFVFFGFVEELRDVGKGRYGATDAAFYVLTTIPRVTYELFPIAALLGSIIGLGTLASNSELTVMRASGVALKRIVWSVMKAGIALLVLAIVVGEVLAPMADEAGQVARSTAISGSFTYAKKNGLWARDGDSYINIREVLAGERLGGISIFEFDDRHRLTRITQADEARYKRGDWSLHGVRIKHVGEDSVTPLSHEQISWETSISPDLLNVVSVRPNTLSFSGLYQYVTYMRDNGLNAAAFELALWNKLATPLITLVMIFLSVPFVFGPLRSVGVGQRILAGALLGIGFHLFNRVFNYLTLVFEFDPLISAWTPTFAFAFLAVVLARRVR